MSKKVRNFDMFCEDYNLNFNYGKFAVIESQEALNRITISQMTILSNGDIKEFGVDKGSDK